MKKALSIILVVVLCFSLYACGGADVADTVNTDTANTDTEKTNQLSAKKTISDEYLELCIIGSNFTTRGPLAIEPIEDESDDTDSEVYCTVYLGVKNIGKSEYTLPSSVIGTLNYSDGYEFSANTFAKLSSCNWIGAKYILPDNYLPETLVDLKPLGDAELLAVIFVVPREVMEKSDNPASITINLGEKQYIYDLRTDSDILSAEGDIDGLAETVISKYQEAWLIRNITYCMENLYDDVSFVHTYVGNKNGAGELKFSDDMLGRIRGAFEAVYQEITIEEIEKILPETAKLLKEIQSDCNVLCDNLDIMGATNDESYVESIRSDAWELMKYIVDAATSDEMMKYGRFAQFN